MPLVAADWLVVALFFGATTVVGLLFARRGSQSLAAYFTAGRSLPWWLSGTSMVATTFAADTPLAVTALVAQHGIAGNWVWWNMVAGNLLTVFFFARLWRRAGVKTDAELTELRYGGRPAAALRAFRAVYLALPVNLVIIGWVNLAMVKVLEAVLGVDPFVAMLGLFALTVLYASLSGLWGVVVTDFLQFPVAMLGCVVLAVYAVDAVGGLEALAARTPPLSLELFPTDAEWMPPSVMASYLAVQWWAAWYPGSEPGGGGYVAQRIVACRSERDGLLATLWFTIAHYAVRPWPWILTALAASLLYPGLADKGVGFVKAIELLPAGLKGLLLAAFGAAYMSTLSTQLNWGASYLVNDVVGRFTRWPESALVRSSRLVTAALFVTSALVTWGLSKLGSVDTAWRVLIARGAGTGPVYLLRWYWWRVNAWSEIAAMGFSFTSFLILTAGGVFDPADPIEGAWLMLVNTAVTTVGWLAVTLLTRPEADAVLQGFHDRTHPGGPGWRRFSGGRASAGGASMGLAGLVGVYGVLFGVGRLLLGPRVQGAALLALGIAGFIAVAALLRRSSAA
ncbi:MAG: sodium:solute symporter family protein [Myxococcaceae bacterium]|nr:sodium:solute symporter family protein [Myxococcaceae bacterium]